MGRLKTVVCPACGVSRSTKAEGRTRLACAGCGKSYVVVEAAELGAAGTAPAGPAGVAPGSPPPPAAQVTGPPAGSTPGGLGEVRVAAFEEVEIPAPPRRPPRPAPSPQASDVDTPPPPPSAETVPAAVPEAPPASPPPPPVPGRAPGRRRPAGGPGYYLGRRGG